MGRPTLAQGAACGRGGPHALDGLTDRPRRTRRPPWHVTREIVLAYLVAGALVAGCVTSIKSGKVLLIDSFDNPAAGRLSSQSDDLSRPLRASASFDGEHWRQRFDLPLGKAIWLFVGTSHGPNVPAVRAIRGLADRLAGQGRDDILFLVVGDAAPPERRGTFIALGGIEQPALDALYLMSDVVLVPLQAGTGTLSPCTAPGSLDTRES